MSSPQFKGHCSFLNGQTLGLLLFIFLNTFSKCADYFMLLTFFNSVAADHIFFTALRHFSQRISTRSHCFMCFFAESNWTCWPHQTHSACKVCRRLLARRFLLKAVIGFERWQHAAVSPEFIDPLNCSTQKPQKLWPHRIATLVSRKGFWL